jgi:hypothetical protein
MEKNKEERTDENNNNSFLEELLEVQGKKSKQYQKSMELYSKGIIIFRKTSRLQNLKPNLNHLKIILSSIDNFDNNFPHLFDTNGGLNVRYTGRDKNNFLLIFRDDVDIEKILSLIKESSNSKKNKKLLKLANGESYSFSVYQGVSPLDARTNIRVTVQNPDPEADKTYYQDFGDIVNCKRRNGTDHITYKTLKPILPALKEHQRWRKAQKGNVFFFLDPNEENKAAPLYSITTKLFKLPKGFDAALEIIKSKYPKTQVSIIPAMQTTQDNAKNIVNNAAVIQQNVISPAKTPDKDSKSKNTGKDDQNLKAGQDSKSNKQGDNKKKNKKKSNNSNSPQKTPTSAKGRPTRTPQTKKDKNFYYFQDDDQDE